MVLREENVSVEYFSHMLDLLVAMKNGFVNGVRVRIGRVHVSYQQGFSLFYFPFQFFVFEVAWVSGKMFCLKSNLFLNWAFLSDNVLFEARISLFFCKFSFD